MSQIFISYSKQNKNSAKKIVNFLENNHLPCWMSPRDLTNESDRERSVKEAIRNSKLLILIHSVNANQASHILSELEYAVKQNISIVLIKTDNSIISPIFLKAIKASKIFEYDDSQIDTSFETVLQYISENNFIQPVYHEDEESETVTNQGDIKVRQRNIIIAISILVISAVILFVYYNPFAENVKIKSDIVGKWRLVDYQSDEKVKPADYDGYLKGIDQLKQNFSLFFREDKSFERTGFQTGGERGIWSFSSDGKTLYLQTKMNDEHKDQLGIDTLTTNKLILRVAERMQDSSVVTVRLTLQKQE